MSKEHQTKPQYARIEGVSANTAIMAPEVPGHLRRL